MLSEWTNKMSPRRPSQANCPGTTQPQGKLVPIQMTQLHLCILKTSTHNIYKQVCLPCNFIPGKSCCGKTGTSRCAHPASSSQARTVVAKQVQAGVLTLPVHPRQELLWQNRYKQVCSPCQFIPGKGMVAKSAQASVLTLPLHPRQKHCGKTTTGHPAISPQAKALWQNTYKQVCSPCHFIPGVSSVAKQLQASVLTLPFHPRQKMCGGISTSSCADPAISSQAKA